MSPALAEDYDPGGLPAVVSEKAGATLALAPYRIGQAVQHRHHHKCQHGGTDQSAQDHDGQLGGQQNPLPIAQAKAGARPWS